MSSNFSIFDYIDFMNQIKEQKSITNDDTITITDDDDKQFLDKKKFTRINIPNATITNFYNRFYQNFSENNESTTTTTTTDSKSTRYRKSKNSHKINRQSIKKTNETQEEDDEGSSSSTEQLEIISI